MRKLFLYPIILLAVSCTTGPMGRTNRYLTYVPSNYPEAKAVILLEEGQSTIEVKTLSVFQRVHRIIKLFDKSCFDELGNVSIGYNRSYESIVSLKAWTIKPDGRVISVNDIYEETVVDLSGVNDVKRKVIVFPGLEEGCIIEYDYTIQSKLPGPRGWIFMHVYPTLLSRFTLIMPEGWAYLYHCKNGTPKERVEEMVSHGGIDWAAFIWEMEDIPPLKEEPCSPPLVDIAPSVYFTPASIFGMNVRMGWRDVAKFVEESYLDRSFKSHKLESFAHSETMGCGDALSKAKKLYSFVQKNIRYVAISLGLGGWLPTPPEKVMDRRYGDCKDKAVLLVNLLRSEGIEAYPALVRTRDEGLLDETIPSLQFNHAIVKAVIGGKSYFLDPVYEFLPFGSLMPNCYGVRAFVVGAGERYFEDITVPPAFYNALKVVLVGAVNDDGSLKGKMKMQFSGYQAVLSRSLLSRLSEEERFKNFEALLKSYRPEANISNFELSNLGDLDSSLTLIFDIDIGNYAKVAGEYIFVPTSPIPSDIPSFSESERKYPVYLDFPFTVTFEETLSFNRPVAIERKSEPRISSDWGSFVVFEDIRGTKLVLTKFFSLKVIEVSPRQYKGFKKFLDTVRAKDNEELLLRAR
ncbi:MAG: DUF3857 and transglutaminase domain-containing protein [Candidatus Hydrothermae bacterium]|nr:DUF3857 and transglutaminase domain-containing protein [Candidatus Hydrothermae bacterium]